MADSEFEDTPKRGREQKSTRLAQLGARLRKESWSEERPREERARTAWQLQKERDDRESQRIQIKIDQQKARMAKLEHQRKEDEDANDKTRDKQKPSSSKPKTSPIIPFRAVNEPEPTDSPTPGDPDGTAESADDETEESTEVFRKESSGDDSVVPDSGAESDNLRGTEEDYNLEPEFDHEHDIQPQDDDPEREVSFTPLLPPTKNARRNFRRRRANKKQRTQDNADKKRREINERLRHKREKSKLQSSNLRSQRAQTSSTDIMTDSDDRASTRNSKEPKSRRESQESIEELDSKGRKVPTNKYKNRRH